MSRVSSVNVFLEDYPSNNPHHIFSVNFAKQAVQAGIQAAKAVVCTPIFTSAVVLTGPANPQKQPSLVSIYSLEHHDWPTKQQLIQRPKEHTGVNSDADAMRSITSGESWRGALHSTVYLCKFALVLYSICAQTCVEHVCNRTRNPQRFFVSLCVAPASCLLWYVSEFASAVAEERLLVRVTDALTGAVLSMAVAATELNHRYCAKSC